MGDDINTYWNGKSIIKYVDEYVEEKDIQIIFTFDGKGISGHPNHCSIFNALQTHRLQKANQIDIYSLKTVGICRKYCAYLDALWCLLTSLLLNCMHSKSDIVILSAPNKCWDGMCCHQSQFVWYRKLVVVFSRYSWMNEFDKLHNDDKK